MNSVSAKNTKNSSCLLLDTERAEPIVIEKHRRAVAVVIAAEEYEKLKRVEESVKIKAKGASLGETNKPND